MKRVGCEFSDEPTNPSLGEGRHVTCVFVLLLKDSNRMEGQQNWLLVQKQWQRHRVEQPQCL